jgi:hypothetical protein
MIQICKLLTYDFISLHLKMMLDIKIVLNCDFIVTYLTRLDKYRLGKVASQS